MSNVTVCARFRPLCSKEMRDDRDGVCVRGIDADNFVFQVCTGYDSCNPRGTLILMSKFLASRMTRTMSLHSA